MEAIPSHCTLQPPVLELTGPQPGGALQMNSHSTAARLLMTERGSWIYN